MGKTQWVTTTQVLQALKTSDDNAVWEMFHSHFYPVIYNFGRKMGLSEHDAEDSAQEAMMAFLKAYRKGGYDREKGRLCHWLYGVARKVIMNRRKKVPPEKQIADNTTGTSYWNLVRDDQNALAQVTWDGEWRQMVLQKCLERAKEECGDKVFQAFELYALSQLPLEEVCKQMNMSKNAVYIAKTRVLTRLRKLEHQFDDDCEGSLS
jgi:RNA polymerase sigma factor (sigma-70 family)